MNSPNFKTKIEKTQKTQRRSTRKNRQFHTEKWWKISQDLGWIERNMLWKPTKMWKTFCLMKFGFKYHFTHNENRMKIDGKNQYLLFGDYDLHFTPMTFPGNTT